MRHADFLHYLLVRLEVLRESLGQCDVRGAHFVGGAAPGHMLRRRVNLGHAADAAPVLADVGQRVVEATAFPALVVRDLLLLDDISRILMGEAVRLLSRKGALE